MLTVHVYARYHDLVSHLWLWAPRKTLHHLLTAEMTRHFKRNKQCVMRLEQSKTCLSMQVAYKSSLPWQRMACCHVCLCIKLNISGNELSLTLVQCCRVSRYGVPISWLSNEGGLSCTAALAGQTAAALIGRGPGLLATGQAHLHLPCYLHSDFSQPEA